MTKSTVIGQWCCLVAAAVFLFFGVKWFQAVRAETDHTDPFQKTVHKTDSIQDETESIPLNLQWGRKKDDVPVQWEEAAGWVSPQWGNEYGAKTAMAPKNLRLAWRETSRATKHEIYRAYSPVPFGKRPIVYQQLAITSKPGAVWCRESSPVYTKLGYYRFKVVPVFSDGWRGSASPVLELALTKRIPPAQIVPRWVNEPCWNAKDIKNISGPRQAFPPQNLWLDWFDIDETAQYLIYQAYSPTPFQNGAEKYQLLLKSPISAYHSADRRFLTGGMRKFTKKGYYRFKIQAISTSGQAGRMSDFRELVLK